MARRTPSTGVRRAAAALVLALAAPMLAAATGSSGPLGTAPAQAAPLHTLVNPTFDTGLAGWFESTAKGSLSGVAGRRGAGVRLTHTATSRYTVILNDTANTVTRTVAGGSYTATAWVRATTSTPVSLRLQEWSGGVKRAEVASTVTVGTTWTLIGVNHVATRAGSGLDLNLLAPALPARAAVDVDDVTFRSRTPSWVDDFDSETLDSRSWTALNASTFGDGNLELACLTSRPQNLTVADGALALTARREPDRVSCGSGDDRFPGGREYSSAFVQTKGKRAFTYGRFAVRAQLPTAPGVSRGMWPAFWMRPVDGGLGELDIMEAIGSGSDSSDGADSADGAASVESTRVHQSLHYDYLPTQPVQKVTATLPGGALPSGGLHTYAVEWDAGQIQWFIDGRLTQTRTTASTPWLAAAFSRPMYLRLNLAVGGRWPGTPDATTRFPATYLIDQVSVHTPAT
ncbi:MAG: family 16 glycosylhydrolase [Kineosporiaceae bacterium]|nr:family 16 glycosylhydrolase [Kineosporiaceae bacterium]